MIFLGGCNFRCPFCHNPGLVLPQLISRGEGYSQYHVLVEVARRRKLVRGLVISGGEPTLQEELLVELLRKARELGLATKLDTNGSNPRVLSRLL